MPALRGVGVLVTRPERQSALLCRLLEAAGAEVIRFPMLDITPSTDSLYTSNGRAALQECDLMLFTSTNAVTFGARLLDDVRPGELAAIGPATARALEERGFPPTLMPTEGFDSEHLLAHPWLRQCAGRRIVIVTGKHGRELLRDQLTTRGAEVVLAEVYQRERVKHPPDKVAMLTARLNSGDIDVITATSVEIANSLLTLPPASLRPSLERCQWVVPSLRVAGALREQGLTAPLLQADSADDHDLVTAIARWRSSVSGA